MLIIITTTIPRRGKKKEVRKKLYIGVGRKLKREGAKHMVNTHIHTQLYYTTPT